MSTRRPHTAYLPLIAISTAIAGLSVLATAFASPQALMEKSFSSALTRLPAQTSRAADTQTAAIEVERSQAALLDLAGLPGSSAASAGFEVGAKITIASSGMMGSASRQLEVIDVHAVPAGMTRIDTSDRTVRLMLVTCREVGASAGPLVRFIVEDSRPAPGLPIPVSSDHAL